jgi:hypothetical protein
MFEGDTWPEDSMSYMPKKIRLDLADSDVDHGTRSSRWDIVARTTLTQVD